MCSESPILIRNVEDYGFKLKQYPIRMRTFERCPKTKHKGIRPKVHNIIPTWRDVSIKFPTIISLDSV